MDMMKMMGQLQESQRKVEEAKNKMQQEYITEKSSDGSLEVTVSKAGRVKDVNIGQDLLQDNEQLADYLILTLNKALEKAQTAYDGELENIARSSMPKLPGMGF
ncbi:MAG: YbaB/EbfC family nucleoid-associated protein [Weeksellaceae bacterium]|nr:YbaB/EbfC family nucleoid-associated protein [Weeksellaceae bacterium]